MTAAQVLSKIREFLNPQNLIIMLAVSSFAPVPFTALAIIFAIVMILITPQYQRGLFHFRGAFLIPAFCIYAFVVAFFNKNILGLIVAPVFFMMFVIVCFVRRFITSQTFETALTGVCFMVPPATIYALIEVLTNESSNGLVYRCASYFFNANYFGALMAVAIIICAYRIVESRGRAYFYYPIALLALFNIYLSASLFAIVEAIVGVAVYLLFSKHYRLFCLMVICGSLGIMAIVGIPELLPRLSEADSTTSYRVRIWGVAIREIMRKPLFGGGFMSYASAYKLYEGSYPIQHCHNIFIESMLDFGIVGTSILMALLYYVARKIIVCFKKDKTSPIMVMIIAIMFAVLSHCFTDITFFWIQTGLFYCIIVGSIGAEERRLNIKNDVLIKGRYRI